MDLRPLHDVTVRQWTSTDPSGGEEALDIQPQSRRKGSRLRQIQAAFSLGSHDVFGGETTAIEASDYRPTITLKQGKAESKEPGMNNSNRRGVLLLVVLALLAMFAMVAVAFVVLTGAESAAAVRLRTNDAVRRSRRRRR